IGVWEQAKVADRLQAGDHLSGGTDVVLYLHAVADPGNVGAVLRSALALAPTVVVLSPETADPFGPKAVRASMGAIFGQPVLRSTFPALRSQLPDGVPSIALAPRAGKALRDANLQPPVAICLG